MEPIVSELKHFAGFIGGLFCGILVASPLALLILRVGMARRNTWDTPPTTITPREAEEVWR